MVRLSPSHTRASAGIATLAPTAVMSPSRITTVPRAMTLPGPVTMRALRMAWTRGVAAAAGRGASDMLAASVASSRAGTDPRSARARGTGREGSADRGIAITSDEREWGAAREGRTGRALYFYIEGNGARRLGAREEPLKTGARGGPRSADRRG